MKLLIDFGNTRVKVAASTPSGIELLYCGPVELPAMKESVRTIVPDGGMWCTVRPIASEIEEWMLSLGMKCLTGNTPIPLKVNYGTPGTLGMDRVAAAVGAWSIKPGNDLLVIDAGTAITTDLVSSDGTFVGGNIGPGIGLRFKGLHEHTGCLPLVDRLGDCPEFGYDTETAIRSGVLRGVRLEMDALIEKTRQERKNLLVFLTGGDADCFDLKGKSGIFAVCNLVLQGLDCIEKYNEN